MADLNVTIDRATQISRWVAGTLDRRLRVAQDRYRRSAAGAQAAFYASQPLPTSPFDWWQDAREYTTDAMQRMLLFWDTLRERGNNYLAHEAAGKPPLLHYPWEMVADAPYLRAAGEPRPGAHLPPRTTGRWTTRCARSW